MNRCIQPSTARASASGYLQDCPRQFSGRSFKWRNWNPSFERQYVGAYSAFPVFGCFWTDPNGAADHGWLSYPIPIYTHEIPVVYLWNLKKDGNPEKRLADRLADLRSGLSHLAHLHGRPATGLGPLGSLGSDDRPRTIGRKRSVPRWGWKPPPQGESSHGQWTVV